MKHNLPITVSATAYFAAAAHMILLPLYWFTAWLAATLVHEAFHLLVIWMYKVPLYNINITASGVKLETAPMPYLTECLCALAGPIGVLLLLPGAHRFPTFVVCAYVQSIYNLLPVYPLDGGRALRCILLRFLPYKIADRVGNAVALCVLLALLAAGFFASFRLNLGPIPAAAALFFLFRWLGIKIPCKDDKLRVQ